jgi:cell division protein FtsI (penicillin-binding protein 3)
LERRSKNKLLNVRFHACCVLFNILIVGGLGLVLAKAFQLQVIERALWVDRARAQVQTTSRVHSYRGSIYDRQGRLLSFSVPQSSLYADGEQLENPRKIACLLSGVLGEPEASIEKKLARSRQFIWLKRHLTDQEAAAIAKLNHCGLNLTCETKRFYPYRQVGGQVLGFVGLDGTGLEGVEKGFDHILKENSVAVGQLRDGVRKNLWMKSSLPPEPGESLGVRLTIDALVQYLAECELEKAVQKYRARAGEVVVMDARTSEILAMAHYPFFDPNLPDKNNPELWRNRIITDSFEPGSTFKVFLISAAMQENVVKAKDRVFCENGKYKLARHTINDVHPYGWLTIAEVVKFSSNIAASKVALQVGNERYFRYIQAFGFGSLTGVHLPGEVKGIVRHYRKWRPIDLAVAGFGQSIGVTALQLNTAIAVLANGGEYIPPLIARAIVDAEGQVVESFEPRPLRRVIHEKTAEQIRAMMHSVTQEGGTGVNAAPEGYTAAGKTGTAQVMDPVSGRYASNRYTSLFTGFIPADNPRLVMTVVIHEPKGAIYGGVVAAPVFRDIAAKALPYLGVLPSTDAPVPAQGFRVTQAKPPAAPGGTPRDAGKKSSEPPAGGRTRAVKSSNSVALPAGPVQVQAGPVAGGPAAAEKYSLTREKQNLGLY